ncbi:hypothetical protein ACFWDZ_33060, partial [Micromonospora aurantiaca]|uniref:recombination directionality factor n=1 Tax=Micromonospora aurantiaca (nom. illeg.) TaxID=47850 RepID=UPI0036486EBE
TSPSREILASVAELYGGEVKPWTPANGGPSEFEVYSNVNRLPVLIPPRDAVSQWYELYAGSQCKRRCDGRTEQKSDRPCMCDPENRDCAITTRVNVMLRDVPALGQWLLVSKGYHAAVTLPPAAELLAQAGGYVAGWLGMEEKTATVNDKPTRFKVPTLDVEITPAALMEGKVTGAPAVAKGPERVAITGGRPDYAALLAEAKTSDEVGALWTKANQAGHLDDALATAMKARAAELKAPAAPEQQGSEEPHHDHDQRQPDPADHGAPDDEGVYDAEVVYDDPAEVQGVWFQIIAAAGQFGLTTAQVEAGFAERNGGTHPSSGTVAQMTAYLAAVKAGEVR